VKQICKGMAIKHLLFWNQSEREIGPRYIYKCELKCRFCLNKYVLRNVVTLKQDRREWLRK
jgi:hypothetical protein